MSAMVSRPTLRRTISGGMPHAFCCSAFICECVVVAGWMASVRASPTLATWLTSFSESMNARPAAGPSAALMPKITMGPPLPLRYLRFFLYWGSSFRPGYLTHATLGCALRCVATLREFSQWRSMRRDSVSMPWRNCQELSGAMHPPRLRSGTVSMRSLYARGARASGRSWPQRRPPYDVSGLSNSGCLPAPHLKPPLSITMPPMPVPWPPIHFVRELMMMSAPCSKGLHRYGVEKVLSTMSGMPKSCATAEMASRSQISSAGLDTVSQNTARVLSLMAARKFSGFSASTNVTVMPRVGRMSLNCV
mmetsp:Transcript_7243/g.18421  ORF Transcript_7243/g.18421 Transcript_7243/m.18421 type:complete len:306 (-) Transcript_7243:438-1355(-)